MRVIIINGPNLNMLDKREKIYGEHTLQEIERKLTDTAKELGIEIDFFQSNSEGSIIDKIHEAIDEYDGLIINPGAYTHYSIAVRDALSIFPGKKIEVHLTNIFSREEYRRKTVTGEAVDAVISGAGHLSYIVALHLLRAFLKGDSDE